MLSICGGGIGRWGVRLRGGVGGKQVRLGLVCFLFDLSRILFPSIICIDCFKSYDFLRFLMVC